MDLTKVSKNIKIINIIFPQNSIRKNYFLAACLSLDSSLSYDNMIFINDDCRYGGIIGIDNSNLDKFLSWLKIIRIHAIFHDAAGYMRTKHGVGPGYCYMFSKFPVNSCYLGHVSGLVYCCYLKIFSSFYNRIDC